MYEMRHRIGVGGAASFSTDPGVSGAASSSTDPGVSGAASSSTDPGVSGAASTSADPIADPVADNLDGDKPTRKERQRINALYGSAPPGKQESWTSKAKSPEWKAKMAMTSTVALKSASKGITSKSASVARKRAFYFQFKETGGE